MTLSAVACEATLDMTGARPSPACSPRWREEVAGGRLQRPARKPVGSHRPAKPAQLARDMHLQFTIEVLDRTGIKPNGSDVSGCRIVADVLGLSEDTVTRTWKARVQKGPFVSAMQKQMKAIAERNGPFHTTGGLSEAQARVPPVSLSGSGRSLQISVTRGAYPWSWTAGDDGTSGWGGCLVCTARHNASRNSLVNDPFLRRRAALRIPYGKTKSGQKRPKSSGRTGPEPRVVRVDCNSGPDAEDRLRRLFTLLVTYAARDRLPVPEKDSPSDASPAEDHAEDEA